MESIVTNKELLAYCEVFYLKFLKIFLAEGKYPRINLYTKEGDYAVMSLYSIKDKSAQGIVIYEGNQNIDEPIERAQISHDSYYVSKLAHSSCWTPEAAKKDLEEALTKMDRRTS